MVILSLWSRPPMKTLRRTGLACLVGAAQVALVGVASAGAYTRAFDETTIDSVSSVVDQLTPPLEAGLHTLSTVPTSVLGGGGA